MTNTARPEGPWQTLQGLALARPVFECSCRFRAASYSKACRTRGQQRAVGVQNMCCCYLVQPMHCCLRALPSACHHVFLQQIMRLHHFTCCCMHPPSCLECLLATLQAHLDPPWQLPCKATGRGPLCPSELHCSDANTPPSECTLLAVDGACLCMADLPHLPDSVGVLCSVLTEPGCCSSRVLGNRAEHSLKDTSRNGSSSSSSGTGSAMVGCEVCCPLGVLPACVQQANSIVPYCWCVWPSACDMSVRWWWLPPCSWYAASNAMVLLVC